jgi:two-component system, LytTR family, sensor kinase
MAVNLIRGRRLKVSLHLLTWLVVFVLPTYLLYIDAGNDKNFLYRQLIQIFLYALVFYVNFFFLAPRFFFHRKKKVYFLLSGALVILSTFVFQYADSLSHGSENPPPRERSLPGIDPPGAGFPAMPFPDNRSGLNRSGERRPRPSHKWPVYNFLLMSLVISGFGLGLRFSEKLEQNEAERKEAEKAKVETELAFLRNQINPHFFFNTLNNIYALVESNVESGQKAIHRLSKMMRYILNETPHDNVRLSQEIEFLRNYIELEKLRLSEKIELDIAFPGEFSDMLLPPLLFLPFIENAFKHGVSYRNPSFLSIRMKIGKDSLRFECSNSIHTQQSQGAKNRSGIGLENIRKRLALLFPDRYDLKIFESDSSFNVLLDLDISECSKI